jgi:quinoprotein dehydrogenase-associated probable ABC transporter substrate-binding protein
MSLRFPENGFELPITGYGFSDFNAKLETRNSKSQPEGGKSFELRVTGYEFPDWNTELETRNAKPRQAGDKSYGLRVTGYGFPWNSKLETRNSKPFARQLVCVVGVLLLQFLLAFGDAAASGAALRVCADPNNLPFSNERGEGFENEIAKLIAREFDAPLQYTWWAQRRGFVRNTLREKICDLIIGVPAGYDPVLTTRTYYRSTYGFVSRRESSLAISSLDDPRLRRLRIGVHLMGDDGANAPPGHALARRGIIDNVAGYTIYGDYNEPNPPARLIDAVASGAIDVAVAWGPLAGYFVQREPVPLQFTPISPPTDPPALRFVFAIAMGVRKRETPLRDRLNDILERRRDEIQAILHRYGVPQVTAERPG